MMRIAALSLIAVATFVAPALAAETAPTPTTPIPAATPTPAPTTTPAPATKAAPAKTPEKFSMTAPGERLDQKTEEMLKGLTEDQVKQFATIRTAHGTLRAVDDVKDSLERAVKSCGEHNPEMKDEITNNFQTWKNEVLPVVRQGEARLDKMILSQEFARPSKIRAYFKAFDDMVKAKNNQFTEVPVSTKESCETMNENMEKSQRVMARLLIETLGLDKEPAPAKTED